MLKGLRVFRRGYFTSPDVAVTGLDQRSSPHRPTTPPNGDVSGWETHLAERLGS